MKITASFDEKTSRDHGNFIANFKRGLSAKLEQAFRSIANIGTYC